MFDALVTGYASHCSVPGMPRVYLLSRTTRAATFYVQQRRAFNLIWALKESGRLKEGDRLAVVGGGLAGVTAAAAAYSLGLARGLNLRVEIYEKKEQFLHLLVGARHRFIHPNYYDWPGPNYRTNKTDLPFLNWEVDTCDDVIAGIAAEWDRLFAGRGRIKARSGVEITKIYYRKDARDNRPFLSGTGSSEPFEHIILALGFGLEKQESHIPFVSYWRADAIEQSPLMHCGPRKHFLVAGAGDGGLIDLIRVRIVNFNPENFVDEIYHPGLSADEAQGSSADEAKYEKFVDELLLIEKNFKLHQSVNGTGADGSAFYWDAYEGLFQANGVDLACIRDLLGDQAFEDPSTAPRARPFESSLAEYLAHLLFRVCQRLRPVTSAALVGSDAHPTTANACPLNRFSVFLIFKAEAVLKQVRDVEQMTEYVSGSVAGVRYRSQVNPERDHRYLVNIVKQNAASQTRGFDEVVYRIGPDSKKVSERFFKEETVKALDAKPPHFFESVPPWGDPWRQIPDYFPVPPMPPAPLVPMAPAPANAWTDHYTALGVCGFSDLGGILPGGLGLHGDWPNAYFQVDLESERPAGLPDELEGIRVVYVLNARKKPIDPPQQGVLKPLSIPLTCGLDIQNQQRMTIDLGAGGSAGAAIGCFVKVSGTGEVGFVSTNAGIAALNHGQFGVSNGQEADKIVRMDVAPADPKRVVARLRDYIKLTPLPSTRPGIDVEPKNHYSLALAILEPGCEYYANYLPADLLGSEDLRRTWPRIRPWPRDPHLRRAKKRDVVCKYTLDGEPSRGKIVSVKKHIIVPIPASGPRSRQYRFDGVFEIEPMDGRFDGEGDAGTVVVREDDGVVLGMIFATDAGSASNVWGFPIDSALQRLGCELIFSELPKR